MNDLHIYLLKVSAGLAIISVPYYFLLRNDPNLNLKRFYLLLGLIASWIFPLIVFRKPDLMLNLTPTIFIDPGEEEALPISISNIASTTGITINWIKIGVRVYLTGLTFMFFKNLVILLKWNIKWKKDKDESGIAFTRSDQVFTIFSRIFVPGVLKDKEDLHNILLHEKAHVQQFHFIDLMIVELTLLLTWFNPFSWLISRMIKENHEHLADRQVLSTGINSAQYRAQLLNHTLGVNVFRLGNQFNHSLTLKRFKMMKKPKNSPRGIITMTLLVPALLIAMGLTTGMTPMQEKTIKGKVVLAPDGSPAPGTSVVIANSSVGTVADTDGSFMLNVEGDPDLIFSFVGFASLKVKASKVGKKPLELEAETYNLDLESVPLEVKKEENGSKNEEEVDVLQHSDEVFYVVEEMPMFPGGKAALKTYIYSNLDYPANMKKKASSGEVMVQFTVPSSGELRDIKAVSSTHKEFEASAVKVFESMPAWNPGRQRGKPVMVNVVVPVKFNGDKE